MCGIDRALEGLLQKKSPRPQPPEDSNYSHLKFKKKTFCSRNVLEQDRYGGGGAWVGHQEVLPPGMYTYMYTYIFKRVRVMNNNFFIKWKVEIFYNTQARQLEFL